MRWFFLEECSLLFTMCGLYCHLSSGVEHTHGKGGVSGSIPEDGSRIKTSEKHQGFVLQKLSILQQPLC